MAYSFKKESAFKRFKRKFLQLAFAAAVIGGPLTYRFGTVEEHEAVVRDLRGDKDKGFRVATNKGGFENEDSFLRFNPSESPQEIQDALFKGRTYRFRTYGGIGPLTPNIIAVAEIGGAGLAETSIAAPAPETPAAEPALSSSERAYNEGMGEGFPLTAAEREAAQGFFGGGLETGGLRLHFFTAERPKAATTISVYNRLTMTDPDGNVTVETDTDQRIEFYGEKYSAPDYMRETGFNFSTFFHEMTHVWQGQFQPGRKHHEDGVYEYHLVATSAFGDFGDEQQASIVDDYANRFLQKTPQPSIYYNGGNLTDTDESDALLQKVVEDKFPGARDLRLKAQQEPAYKSSPQPHRPFM